MSVILALLTISVLLLVGLLRSKRQLPHVEEVLVPRYIHHGHTWARETEDGDVLVGVDDFAQSVMGTVDEVELPKLLRKVRQGREAWKIIHGRRHLTLLSPVTGRIVEKNEMVLRNPSLINTAPYGDGWLIRVKTRSFPTQLNNLMTGKAAHEWIDAARARLNGFFQTTPALMYQDGGVMLRGLADRCSDDEWRRLSTEFFHTNEP